MSARVTVYCCNLSGERLRALPGLRAAFSSDAPTDACELFGLRGPDLPVAAITYAHDFGAAPPAWCARLDPVCLLPAGATLRLLDLAAAPLAEADARALFERVKSAGVIEDVEWRYAAPLRWYVLRDTTPDLHTVAPDVLPSGQVAAGQPRGADAPRWQAALNELQMLLFDAPENQAREARDLPPANALWLWGTGSAPRLPAAPFDSVWTDQPQIGGLARLAGREPQAAPASPAAWLATPPSGHALLGLDASADSVIDAWLPALQAALDAGRLDAATLLADGARVELRRRGLLGRLMTRLKAR